MDWNTTRSHTVPTNSVPGSSWKKGHRRRSNPYVLDRISKYRIELNKDCQSPHKTSSSGFPPQSPITCTNNAWKNIIHLKTFYQHLHNTDKPIVQALHVLMHFMSSLKPASMNSRGSQEWRTSDESHPTQLLYHPHHQRHVALQKPCLKGASQQWGPLVIIPVPLP